MYEESVKIVAATTAYGRPGVDLLARQVAELKDGDPLSPVTVVVPTNHAAVVARRALAGRSNGDGNGIVNVDFVTLHRLAERLGGPALAAAGRRPVAVPVIAAAVRAILAEDPGVFAPVADHPATEQALVAAHRELSDVSAHALDAVAAASDRAGDVVRIHRAVDGRLGDTWFDEADLLASATDHIRADAATIGTELGPVVLHQLRDITTAAAEFIDALAGATTVRADVALTGDPAADRAVIATHGRAGIDVDTSAATPPALPRASGVISASDPDDEVRAAIRRLTTWMHDGVPLGRTALLYGSADPYARLLHEQLAAAAIPFNGAPVRAIGDLLLGRTLRALLALPDRNYRRSDVLAVVRSRRWETISRDAGIVDGTDWDTRLGRFADDERALADEILQDGDRDPDENEWRAARHRGNAHEADALREFVARLRVHLDRAHTAPATWAELVAWAHELIDTYVGDPGRRQAWPDDEQGAAHRVEAAIDALAGLDVLADDTPPTLDVFRRTLEGELESSLRRHGRLGDGVLVGPVSMAPGLVLDRVVVLGMAEGAFPPRRLEDSLLPDRERERADGELQLRAQRADDDRRNLLAAIAAVGSEGEAVLAHPRGDLRRNGERPASRWLLAEAARLAGRDTLRSADLAGHAGAAWMEFVASFAAGAARATAHTSAQSLRVAAIARGEHDRSTLLDDDPALAKARTVVRARRSSDFTRFDGNLHDVAAHLGELGTMSASRLQTWAACPHAYLLQYILGVEPLSEPERRIAIDHLDVGTLVHAILDEFVRTAMAERHGDPIRQWGPADRARLHLVAEAKFADAEARGLTGKALLWERDRARISADLDRFVDEDNLRLAADGLAPAATELEFGDVTVVLPSGRALHVRGSVDRVDTAPDGSLVVVDYKTGKPDRYRGLSGDDPHKGGTMLQLYLYAAAARQRLATETTPVRAGYWFNTTRRGGFERIGYEVTPAVEAEVGRAIDVIVDGITSGVFPARPAAKPAFRYVDCWYCTPDGLSGTERRRDWDRKRAAPELLAYAALAEPVDD